METLYYWRRGRANTLYVAFNRRFSEGISAHIKPNEDGTWQWYMKKPFHETTGCEPTQEAAKKKIDDMIAWEFRPLEAW